MSFKETYSGMKSINALKKKQDKVLVNEKIKLKNRRKRQNRRKRMTEPDEMAQESGDRSTGNDGRKRRLNEDIAEDDKEIQRMRKLLRIRTHSKVPHSFKGTGLDYLLDGIEASEKEKDNEVDLETDDEYTESTSALQSSSANPKNKVKELVHKETELRNTQFSPPKPKNKVNQVENEKTKLRNMRKRQNRRKRLAQQKELAKESGESHIEVPKTCSPRQIENEEEIVHHEEEVVHHEQEVVHHEEAEDFEEEDLVKVSRLLRRQFNMVSEDQMSRVLKETLSLFSAHPRALMRKVFVQEIMVTLKFAGGSGWLEMDLSAFISCLHSSLHRSQQQDHLGGHVIEAVVHHMDSLPIGERGSYLLFLAYLYRFDVVIGDLILDLLFEFVRTDVAEAVKSVTSVLKGVGGHLRRDYATRYQELINLSREQSSAVDDEDDELGFAFTELMETFFTKHVNEKAHTLKISMKTWIKGGISVEYRLPLRLRDLREVDSRGRWWVVGSAMPDTGSHTEVTEGDNPGEVQAIVLSEEMRAENEKIERMADRLGLKTATRRAMFTALARSQDHEEAVYQLLKIAKKGGEAKNMDREAVLVVVRCLISELTFNGFYVKVLGKLCKIHRKFKMIIKCAFWDAMAKKSLRPYSKQNCGRTLARLILDYDFPANVLQKYDFKDTSEANVAFLKAFISEISQGNLRDLKPLGCLASFSGLVKNLNMFVSRHFSKHSREMNVLLASLSHTTVESDHLL